MNETTPLSAPVTAPWSRRRATGLCRAVAAVVCSLAVGGCHRASPPAVVLAQPTTRALTAATEPPAGASPAPPAPSTAAPPAREPAPTFVVLHACDDKYDAAPDCRPGKEGWVAWLAALQLTSATRNLLKLDGGGPGGAEWNPGAPLVAFVASAKGGQTQLYLDAGPGFAPVGRYPGYDVFFIPFEAWEAVERGARADELPEGCPTDAVTVVELRVVDTNGEVARGLFAFGRGE